MDLHKKTLMMLLGSVLFWGGCSKMNSDAPVRLIWEMGANQIAPYEYESTFYLINESKDSLPDGWKIYFGQMPVEILSVEEPAIRIDRICSTHFIFEPTQAYRPLAPGDTLVVKFRARGQVIKETEAPEGAYWVWDDSTKAKNPISLTLEVRSFDRESQWSRNGVRELPYPYGENIYLDNERFANVPQVQLTDIIPSVKSIETVGDPWSFTHSVKIVAPKSLQNEADLLREKLVREYGCSDKKSGETEIHLAMCSEKMADEQYRLEARPNRMTIIASTPHGIFNGCQTLLAMLGDASLPLTLPQVVINDYPDLAYRGFMLDVARNFTTKTDLLKLIDRLAAYKVNRLHLHLTDDEGWRLEIPGLEELTTIASRRGQTTDERTCLYPAYGSGWDPQSTTSLGNGFYTAKDFIEILRYAAARHITVIPEVDVPGHSRAAIKAMTARYYKYEKTDRAKAEEYLLHDPADQSKYLSAQWYSDNVLCVARPSVYRFLDKVIDEIHTMYLQAGVKMTRFHLGGDEIGHGAWEQSPICQSFMKEKGMSDVHELKNYFLDQMVRKLASLGVRPAGWQEFALDSKEMPNPEFAQSDLLSYCWSTSPEEKRDEIAYRLANAGYPVLMCNVTNFYLDLAYNKHQREPGIYWGGFLDEYRSFDMLPYQVYKSVRKDATGQAVDLNKVSEGKVALTEKGRAQIAGVQGQLWTELIRSYAQIEYMLFPKIFGLVERGWNASPTWANESSDDAYKQALQKYNAVIVRRELSRLSNQGVNFRVAQPGLVIIEGALHANSPIPGATIRYTVDGSEPTDLSTEWTQPIACEAKEVKAKCFFAGKESVTTLYRSEKR